jgi:hypothetical protein
MDIRQFTFSFDEISFDRTLVYKMLRLNQDEENDLYHQIIATEIEKARGLFQIEGGYQLVDGLLVEKETIYIEDKLLKVGRNIAAYLKKSEKVAIFACTAGKGIEIHSRKLMADGHLLEGYISDVIGSVVVETAMDKIQQNLSEEMFSLGFTISNRYSPGYCNWDVSDQKALFSFLPDRFCSIQLSESCLMSPIKSVSGIIGIGKNIPFSDYACETCNNMTCIYRGIKQK